MMDFDLGRAMCDSLRVEQSWDWDLEGFRTFGQNLICAAGSVSGLGFSISEKTSRSELTPQFRFRSRAMGDAGLVDVSPSDDLLEFD